MITTGQLTTTSETQITVRPASSADAPTLARFRYELRASFHEISENEASFIERCTLWVLERLRTEGHWRCWIAERRQTPVGNIWAQLIEKIPNPIAEPEHYVYLTNFYVREEYRGKGIGTMLLSALLAWSKSNDAELIILWPTERSKPLYLRHGFASADDFMQLVVKSNS